MPDPARLPNRLTEPQAYIDALVARLAAAEEFISKREQIAEAMADRLAAAENVVDELLNDVLVLMDHHTSEELKQEARRRIIERHGRVLAAYDKQKEKSDA